MKWSWLEMRYITLDESRDAYVCESVGTKGYCQMCWKPVPFLHYLVNYDAEDEEGIYAAVCTRCCCFYAGQSIQKAKTREEDYLAMLSRLDEFTTKAWHNLNGFEVYSNPELGTFALHPCARGVVIRATIKDKGVGLLAEGNRLLFDVDGVIQLDSPLAWVYEDAKGAKAVVFEILEERLQLFL